MSIVNKNLHNYANQIIFHKIPFFQFQYLKMYQSIIVPMLLTDSKNEHLRGTLIICYLCHDDEVQKAQQRCS